MRAPSAPGFGEYFANSAGMSTSSGRLDQFPDHRTASADLAPAEFEALLEANAGYINDQESFFNAVAAAQLIAIADAEISIEPVNLRAGGVSMGAAAMPGAGPGPVTPGSSAPSSTGPSPRATSASAMSGM